MAQSVEDHVIKFDDLSSIFKTYLMEGRKEVSLLHYSLTFTQALPHTDIQIN